MAQLAAAHSRGDLRLRLGVGGVRLESTFSRKGIAELNRDQSTNYMYRGKHQVLSDLGQKWGGLSRTEMYRLTHEVRLQLSWRTAERLLTRLPPDDAARLRDVMVPASVWRLRREYHKIVAGELDRLTRGKAWIPPAAWAGPKGEQVGAVYEGKAAALGATYARARLMHIRVWDGITAFSRLRRSLKGRRFELLLHSRYRAELDTIRQEMRVYREMAPFPRRPGRLARGRGLSPSISVPLPHSAKISPKAATPQSSYGALRDARRTMLADWDEAHIENLRRSSVSSRPGRARLQ
jgi:hypothetical protein